MAVFEVVLLLLELVRVSLFEDLGVHLLGFRELLLDLVVLGLIRQAFISLHIVACHGFCKGIEYVFVLLGDASFSDVLSEVLLLLEHRAEAVVEAVEPLLVFFFGLFVHQHDLILGQLCELHDLVFRQEMVVWGLLRDSRS